MELIATRSFRNVGGKIKVKNPLHPFHIPKGQTFEIGTAKTLKELAKSEDKAAELAAALLMAGVAVEPTPEVVAMIEAEIEVDRKREARAKEMDTKGALTAAGAQFADLLSQLSRLPQQVAPARAR